ncbi:MAG TPA: hypothetical protein VEX11_10445 [Acetobacteraceae bacterium]|nr:hypothetical protein [Acetobacteraceae bacterium]
MKRTHLLSIAAAALAGALLAAPAIVLAQRGGSPAGAGDAPSGMSSGSAQNRATAEADRSEGGPAEWLRMAQSAIRRGQTAQANELLERAETRLLLVRAGGGGGGSSDSRHSAQGEAAQHIAEARRALTSRDRAEAMRHTNLAIATNRDANSATGSDPARLSAQGGGGSGMVESGVSPTSGGGRAVLRDGGTGGVSVTRAEAVVLAQTGTTRGGGGGAGSGTTTALPPGDTLPGWSGPRGGVAPAAPGAYGPPPIGATQGLFADPGLGGNARGGGLVTGIPNTNPGASSSSMTGGEAGRLGGAPPADTFRAPGSSGISGAGVGSSAVGGPIR